MKAFRSAASVSSARAMLVPSMKSLSRVTTAIRSLVIAGLLVVEVLVVEVLVVEVLIERNLIGRVVIETSAGFGWIRTSW